ncbi:hypothetical protein CBER1_02809 [Cercospora berteroae]|uniref:Cytochrome P450 n=1 Tax=Cercospora berteroae TaxID=357750 RepID=A0A2S6CBY6_9PEZI|nr:hypothetical protein CBER1_02809 [Cercospora berteroae]
MPTTMFLSIASGLLTAWIISHLYKIFHNYFFHPLSRFPGPIAVSTGWYKAYQEIYLARNWFDVLKELHATYGEIIRIGPNELHFCSPTAYHEIYNNMNRWDKDEVLYSSFGEDASSFGYVKYRDAKMRKDVLAPMFSRRAISELQGVVKEKMVRLCGALEKNWKEGKSSDVLFALRCFTLDTIVEYCFAKDVESMEVEDFQAPVVVAMDASLPSFILFKHFSLLRKTVFGLPGWLTRLSNPALAGLVDLHELLSAQVNEVVQNPASLQKSPHPTIYHRLMNPELNTAAGIPPPKSLFEEALALVFGAVDSAANTTMLGTYHVLQNPKNKQRLLEELETAWKETSNSKTSDASQDKLSSIPSIETLERLPYLTAIIKESLRLSPGVPHPLSRVTPSTGATISNQHIPPGTIVGMSHLFVHCSPECFSSPETFDPDRWLQTDSAALEKWLVPFSRGSRACLGLTLAMCELYFAFALLFWKFDLQLDGTKKEHLAYRECFLPSFREPHMRAFCKPIVR